MANGFEHCRWCSGRGCAACPEEQRKWEAGGGSFPAAAVKPPPPPPEVGPCYACGEPARFLCDGRKGEPTGAMTRGMRVEACDRPMCDAHVAYHSRVRYQKWAEGRGRYCEWDSIDYCRDCLDRLQAEARA